MKSVFDDISTQIIEYSFSEFTKKKNQKKIESIVNKISFYAFRNIKPYLYTIITLLIVIFIINCLQFYYYLSH